MGLSVMAYNNLQVGPYELANLLELKIVKKINDHARLYFTGIVPEGQKDSYVEMTKAQTQIEVNQVDGKSTPLFKGIGLNIEIKAVRDVYHIKVEAVSHTYDLDVKLRSRSFQHKGMPYKELVKQVISGCAGADFIDTASNGKNTGKFIMQYQETDWEFLKRMASGFNAGLVPDAASDKPKFYFGIPESTSRERLEDFHYSVRKNISAFRNSSENFIQGVEENDFIYYEVESDKLVNIGCNVDFKGKSLFVCESVTRMKDSTLKHQYTLTPQKGLSRNQLFNDQIIGLSVQGQVIDVAKDNVKVQLVIDKTQKKEEACWFPYSSVYTAEGNSGWYCMPELHDHVRIYFPNNKEEDGVAISSVRKDTEKGEKNKIDNPDIKYFRTKSGKELMFAPDAIVLSGKDGEVFMKLSEKDGIEIVSKKKVKITAKEDLVVSSEKKVLISAKEELSVTCKESSIKLDGSATIKGKEVKTN